ncbi:unnamed protein product [Lymnaea stagnalis]|uniref:Glutathione peroxidase n=1 Tax=Lymnaea stagnalis TaxID=6523 RepID=A0AAV2I0M3_LYMST
MRASRSSFSSILQLLRPIEFSFQKVKYSYSIGSCASILNMAAGGDNWKKAKSIYEFSALDIDGNNVSLEKYRGKVCLIVNVASK